MDIDISVLRLMEREKDLPFEVLASAIEDALLTAYEKTEGAVHGARVELNRKTGVTIILVEQNLDMIRAMAQRCYVMDKGRIVANLDRAALDDEAEMRRHLAV